MLVANHPRETSIGMKEHVAGDTPLPLLDTTSKFIEHTDTFVQPLMEDEEVIDDDMPLLWTI